MNSVEIIVYNVVAGSYCIEAGDGDRIYTLIKRALLEDKKITISFANIEMITSAFLNNAVGKLYGEFEEDKIKNNLAVKDMEPEDKILLQRVTSTAKLYYKDPEKMRKSVNEILGEGDDEEV